MALTPEEELALKRFIEAAEKQGDPKAKYLPDGKGNYMNVYDIAKEIKKGTDFGRELLNAILALDK